MEDGVTVGKDRALTNRSDSQNTDAQSAAEIYIRKTMPLSFLFKQY